MDGRVEIPAHGPPSPLPTSYDHDQHHRASYDRHTRKAGSVRKEYDPPEVRDDHRPRVQATMPLPPTPIPRQDHITRTSSTRNEPGPKEHDFQAQDPRCVRDVFIAQSRPGVLATMPLPPPPIPRPDRPLPVKERISSRPHPVPTLEVHEETVYSRLGKRIHQ